ncbi:hypothetical protein TNCV_726511 [Trichonephila clavipes]|nr:hypothetical protein TNCV_726511 [Trichonephila clavipes]
MFPSWLSASSNFRIEVRGHDHRKPIFLPWHGLDAENVKEQMRIPARVPEQPRFEIMLSQSKIPIELAFFFMMSVTNNNFNFYLAATIILLSNPRGFASRTGILKSLSQNGSDILF